MIRVEINEKEMKKTKVKINKTESWMQSLKRMHRENKMMK